MSEPTCPPLNATGAFYYIDELADVASHNISPDDVTLLRDVAYHWHFPSVARQEEILDLAERLSKLLEKE